MARKPRTAFPAAAPPAPDLSGDMSAPRRRAPMFAKGAASLETAQQSAAAEARMFRNVPLDLIDPSPIRDRIDISENLEPLKRSLAEEGQQIPILLRPKPGTDRFEIVTGRRRLQALRELGRDSIQAFVRRMSDEDAFVAQGVENNERLETSFIERARTILSALEAGFTQKQVERFLGVDQTMISRMKTIYSGIGEDLVLAIGPARGVGRRKWERLMRLVAERTGGPQAVLDWVPPGIGDSAQRFEAVLERLEKAAPPAPQERPEPTPPPQPGEYGDGRLRATRRGKRLSLEADARLSEGFLDYLQARLPALLAEYDADPDALS